MYIIVTIISPEQFGPEWATYHALSYLAGITFLFSLASIYSSSRTQLRSSIQTFLMLGFILSIGISKAANGWTGGAIASWQVFLPSAAVYFFIVANVTTIRRLKFMTLAAVGSCLVVVVEAFCGYYGGFHGDAFVLQQNLSSQGETVLQFARLRGAGFLSDPNDFAQMLLIALPLIFIAWQKQRNTVNMLMVIVPAAVLLWAIYLTHSRGALIGLALLAILAAQKSMGTTKSVALACLLLVGLVALDFTGGRGISAGDGTDRLEAWANGLEMFKRAPLFGIGFGAFTDFNDITAHNSFVLCLAELGLVGATLWVALLVTTLTSLNRVIGSQRRWEMKPPPVENVADVRESMVWNATPRTCESPAGTERAALIPENAKVEREPAHHSNVPTQYFLAMRLALVGFIATSWFLSRSYTTPMYLILGLATAMIALERPTAKSCIRSRWFFFTLAVEAAAFLCVYGMIRLRN